MPSLLELAGVKSVGALADSPGIKACLQWFTREKQWINEQHLRLSRIPAPTFLEEKRAAWMASQFREIGCEVETDRVGNVIARTGRRQGPYVALTAHLDTVLAPRTPEDVGVEADGRLRGPGVSDNGAGLAALLAVARAITSAPPLEDMQAGLLLVANVCEEGEGNLSGMRYLCQASPLARDIRAFLVLDGPATDHITCQALESRRFEVTFTGPGGHSWSDYGIGNPIHALGRAVANFADSPSNAESCGSPKMSFNFGTIDGGSSVNSIPAQARAKVDIRSENGARMEQLVEILHASVERALAAENERATRGKTSARVREIGSRPGGNLPEDASILAFVRAVDSHLGIRARLDCASTDANIPLSLGLPAISIGAGGQGGGAHTPAEWYHPEGRDVGLKRILLTLCLLMKDPDLAGAAG